MCPSAAEHCRTLTKPLATSIHPTRGTGLKKKCESPGTSVFLATILGGLALREGELRPGQVQAEVRRGGHQNLSAMRKFVLEV